MNSLKDLYVFSATVAYVYEAEEDPQKGEMVERHITFKYLAENAYESLKKAVAHARERYRQYFKDAYKKCVLGSIKVGTECIGTIDLKTGKCSSQYLGKFFEWKMDYQDSLDDYVNSFRPAILTKNNE
jgi:hypothetical protein